MAELAGVDQGEGLELDQRAAIAAVAELAGVDQGEAELAGVDEAPGLGQAPHDHRKKKA